MRANPATEGAVDAAEVRRPAGRRGWPNIGRYSLLLILLGIIVVTGILNPRFLSVGNLLNVLLQVSVLGIVTVAMTLLMISAGLDLSVGSNISLSAVVTALIVHQQLPLGLAIAAGLGTATAIGVLNGLFAATGRAHPFIITLGTMTAWQGAAIILSGGSPINGMGGLYEVLGIRTLLGLPYPVIIFGIMLLVGEFLARRTLIGRYAYAIGGNEEASRLSGVRVRRVKVALYAIAGLFTGVAALVLASILDSALPTMGVGYELQAIAAAVIGGVPLFGGQGRMVNALAGVLLLGLVSNSINIVGVSANLQYVVLGAIVTAAVLLQRRD